MKNRFLTLAILAVGAIASPQAHALVGGPFDNNNYSVLLERGGVYQASLTYRNGSGICQFQSDNSASSQGGVVVDTVFSLGNRSILYYKGITYAGSCTGMADLDARRIFAITNGTTTLSSLENGATTDPVVVNGGFTAAPGFGYANSSYTAKITSTAPLLRFRGRGEASFVMDQDLPTLSLIAYGQGSSATSTDTVFGNHFIAFLAANPNFSAANAATATATLIDISSQVHSIETIENAMERVKMRVYGSRRYF